MHRLSTVFEDAVVQKVVATVDERLGSTLDQDPAHVHDIEVAVETARGLEEDVSLLLAGHLARAEETTLYLRKQVSVLEAAAAHQDTVIAELIAASPAQPRQPNARSNSHLPPPRSHTGGSAAAAAASSLLSGSTSGAGTRTPSGRGRTTALPIPSPSLTTAAPVATVVLSPVAGMATSGACSTDLASRCIILSLTRTSIGFGVIPDESSFGCWKELLPSLLRVTTGPYPISWAVEPAHDGDEGIGTSQGQLVAPFSSLGLPGLCVSASVLMFFVVASNNQSSVKSW